MNTNSSNVRISPDENGNAIRVSKNNPEFGHVRLTQEKVAFGAQGWVNKKTRSKNGKKFRRNSYKHCIRVETLINIV